MRKSVSVVCGTTLLMGLLAGPAQAASAPGSCPAGFEGPATAVELLATPEIERAIADNVYDADHVAAAVAIGDKNGDGKVCWKSVGQDNTHFMVYYAGRYVDNNAAPKDSK